MENFSDNLLKSLKSCFGCIWSDQNSNHYDYMDISTSTDDFTLEQQKNNELRQHMNKDAQSITGEKVTFHVDTPR